jgi:hypothetical protein
VVPFGLGNQLGHVIEIDPTRASFNGTDRIGLGFALALFQSIQTSPQCGVDEFLEASSLSKGSQSGRNIIVQSDGGAHSSSIEHRGALPDCIPRVQAFQSSNCLDPPLGEENLRRI